MNISTYLLKRTSFLIPLAILATSAVLILSTLRVHAAAKTVYTSDFETDTSGWAGSGSTTRVASGENGIHSAEGSYHGVVSGSHAGPNNQLGGYSSVWPGDWSSSIDIYLDPSWQAGQGFIYSVAANRPNGNHLRDFMLNAGVLNDESTGNTNKLVVLADTAGSPTSDPLYHIKAMPVERRGEITTAGWYTLSHNFKNIDGRLVVEISLHTASGQLVKNWVIDYEWSINAIDTDVGGNRYGWFTHATVSGGIAIDNLTRTLDSNKYSISSDATEPVIKTLEEGEQITLVDVVDGKATTPIDITIIGSRNGATVFIPAETTISADDTNWNGVLESPSIQTVNVAGISSHLAVKVGANTPLTFSQPVSLLLPGQAGKKVGFLNAANKVVPIESKCGLNPSETLRSNIHECYTVDGEDIIVWTDHFSTYLSYTSSNPQLAETGSNTITAGLFAVAILVGCFSTFAIRKLKITQ